MKAEYEKKLEAALKRELKALPDLAAPATLAPRVMAAIARRAQVPWYRRSWQGWPVLAQAVSLVLLAILFGGVCFAGWKLPQTEALAPVRHMVGGWLSGAGAVWTVINALLYACVVVVKKLGTGVLIACVAMVAMGYALCVSLGTVYLRLALARRN